MTDGRNVQQAYSQVDKIYEHYLNTQPNIPERWLLAQTLLSGANRRTILNMLPIVRGNQVLDIGTGFGTLAFDLAAVHEVQVDAIDVNQTTLQIASEMYTWLRNGNVLSPLSSVTFRNDNVYGLAYPAQHFDFVMARFVFQHLKQPLEAMKEIWRVTKPGGYVCLIDVDDQLTLTFPDKYGAFTRLQDAFRKVQHHNGGDRFVGRKLCDYLNRGGFEVVGTVIQPDSQYHRVGVQDLGMEAMVQRFREMEEQIVSLGAMPRPEFELNIQQLEESLEDCIFHAAGQVVTLARR